MPFAKAADLLSNSTGLEGNMRGRSAARWRLGAKLAGLTAACIGTPTLAAPCNLGILADLPVTMEGTRASVPAKVNGKETRFWLDSGAFFSFMSQAKAAEFGLRLEPTPFGFSMHGIGGDAGPTQLATIKSFGIVGQELKNVQFLVGGSDIGNGFIGRNILAMRDTEFDLADGSVKLIDPHGCEHAVMAYWASDKPYFVVPLLPSPNDRDHTFKLNVVVNGVRIEAVFDTGAATSLLSRSAALRADIDLSAHDVFSTTMGGVGTQRVRGWVVPVAKIAIGDEQILNTHLNVGDDSHGRDFPDMLLGADFILAHHIYVARGQHRIYFTYSGGKPFHTAHDTIISVGAPSTVAPPALPPGTHLAETVANAAGDPKTAEGFARRGAARLSARDLPGALADLSEAIRQSPDTASYYADRARAWQQSGNAAAADADIDRSLALDPNNGQLLHARAQRRLTLKDRPGALTDAEAAARVTPPASLDSAALAALFVRLHQPARAIAMFDTVIAAHHDDSRFDALLNGRCWARAMANVELDKALADCNRAIKHGGARPDPLADRALVYFRQANYPSAIADFDAALKIAPRQVWSLYVRGLAKVALGQATDGKADMTAAVAIRPDIAEDVAGYGIAGARAP